MTKMTGAGIGRSDDWMYPGHIRDVTWQNFSVDGVWRNRGWR